MNYALAGLLLLLMAPPAMAEAPPPEFRTAYAIVNARLIDGTGGPPLEGATIVIEDGRIKAVGHALATADLPRLDATGLTVLPGLIDSHVHVNSVPGSMIRKDSPLDYASMRAQGLRSYLAAGVTTILDAAAPQDFHAWIGILKEQGHPSPDVLMLAPFLTPAKGYFSGEEHRGDAYANLWEGIDGKERIREYLDAVTSTANVVGVKVTMEEGFGPFALWPTFDAEMRSSIREEAARRNLPVYVHSMKDSMHLLALDLAPKVLVHAGYPTGEPKAETLERIRQSGATVTSTLAVYDMLLVRWERDRLQDPLLRMITPTPQIATANDDQAWAEVMHQLAVLNTPGWMPNFMLPIAKKLFLTESALRKQVVSALNAVQKMHEVGIPIVAGTDSGCWPLLTTMFHGVSMHRELELLVQAGLTPSEAIVAATSRPAQLHGVAHNVGTIETGKQADLILVRGNPAQNISTIRNVEWTVKNGVARTPSGWMTVALQ